MAIETNDAESTCACRRGAGVVYESILQNYVLSGLRAEIKAIRNARMRDRRAVASRLRGFQGSADATGGLDPRAGSLEVEEVDGTEETRTGRMERLSYEVDINEFATAAGVEKTVW